MQIYTSYQHQQQKALFAGTYKDLQYYCKLKLFTKKKITKKPVLLQVFNEWVQYYFYYLNQEVALPNYGCALAEPDSGTQLLLSGY